MKSILTILLLIGFKSLAVASANHYVSSSGNDANPGTFASPWRTIAKVNASMASIIPGDSILFEKNGTYYGSLIMTKSGTAANRIVIGAYGSGAKPVISGLITLSGWTSVRTNVWEASANLKSTVTFITIDGQPYAMGRTPNEGSWLTYQISTPTELSSTALAGVTVYPGEEVVTRKQAYAMSRGTIVSKTGNIISIAPCRAIEDGQIKSVPNGRANYGFFLQNFDSSLDRFGEWYYNPTPKKIRLYSTVNPSAYSIKATSIDTLLILGKQAFITVDSLAFEGAGMYSVESNLGNNITVQNCTFNNNTRPVYIWNSDFATVVGNTINNSFNVSILVSNKQRKGITIDNNTITNNGMLIGAGIYGSHNLKGIVAVNDATTAGNYLNIRNNRLHNIGHHGIDWQGSNAQILNNKIDSFCSKIDDGGGIYTWVNNTEVNVVNYTNRTIANSIISDGVGAPAGTDRLYFAVKGIYIDDQSLNIVVQNNSVYNMRKGMTLNNPKNIWLIDNKFYNCDTAILIDQKEFGPVTGNRITQNQFYQKNANQFNYFYINDNLDASGLTLTQAIQNMAYIDSNYITNLKASGYGYYWRKRADTAYVFPSVLFPLTTWKSTYGHDLVSTLPPVTVTPTNTRMVTNPSDTVLNYSFYGFKKTTPDNISYDNSVNVPRGYNSLILIDNGTSSVPNVPPVAKIDTVSNITLPASSITLKSLSTDADGTINSYNWSYESGPGATIATSTLINTSVNSMLAGSHRFKLVVTDNIGAKDSAYITVVVNPAVAPPNVPPTITAQPADITTTLPSNSINVRSSPRDADGTIVSTVWTKLNGPSCTIVTPNDSVTVISSLVEGTYNFLVTTTDNNGATATANVHVTVLPAPVNTIPIPNSGNDTTIVLPVNSVTLHGSGTPTTAGATIAGYSWAITSGPVGATLGSSSSATTTLNNLTEGVYTIELTITDSNGLLAKDSVTITVEPAPAPPSREVLLFNIELLH